MPDDKKDISDGHHTFRELYDHRYRLFLALCRFIEPHRVWRAKLHADNSIFQDSFVMGIDMAPGEQLTYHLPLRMWEMATFALTLEKAPPYDGHTPSDVLGRIDDLYPTTR